MDPVRAAWLSITTVELRSVVFEALWWCLIGWIPLLAMTYVDRTEWLLLVSPVVWLLVAWPIARLQVRVAAQQSGTTGSLGFVAFLGLALGSLLPALGASLLFGVLGAVVIGGLQIAKEMIGGGSSYGRDEALALFILPFTLATWAVVWEFQGTAMVNIARAQPWFGDAVRACMGAAAPWSRATRWLLAVGVTWVLVALVFGRSSEMYGPVATQLLYKLVPWAVGLTAIGTVAWPVYLVGTTPAGERPKVADVLPKIGDDLANEITTR